jgi:Proteasome subunit
VENGGEMSTAVEAMNVLHLRPRYKLPAKKRVESKAGKAMTIAVGFRCTDGVVLAADTEISLDDGVGKTKASKVFPVNHELSCFLTYTGDSDFVEDLVGDLRRILDRGLTESEALDSIKETYRAFMQKYYTEAPKNEKTAASILVTLRDGARVRLYRGRNRHFTEVQTYSVLGVGQNQGEPLFNPIHHSWLTVNQAAYVMIYALRIIKNFVQGCGGETEIREVPDVPMLLGHLDQVTMATREIEEDFDFLDARLRPLITMFADVFVNENDFSDALVGFAQQLKEYRTERIQLHQKRLADIEELRRRIERDNS